MSGEGPRRHSGVVKQALYAIAAVLFVSGAIVGAGGNATLLTRIALASLAVGLCWPGPGA